MNTLTLSRLLGSMFILVTWLPITGCGFTQAKQDAQKVLARHFQSIATNGYDTAMADYSPQFFQKSPKDEWSKSLARLTTKLGAYQSYSVTSWNVFKNRGTSGAGTTVRLQCQVVYSKYPAVENFMLFKGVGDSDYKILGHQINSDGLLKD